MHVLNTAISSFETFRSLTDFLYMKPIEVFFESVVLHRIGFVDAPPHSYSSLIARIYPSFGQSHAKPFNPNLLATGRQEVHETLLRVTKKLNRTFHVIYCSGDSW